MDEGAGSVSLNRILIAGRAEGLSFDDMRRMTAAGIIDYCIESANARKEPEKPTRRKASQADIDAFFGKRKR
jgi:hypothetical protein